MAHFDVSPQDLPFVSAQQPYASSPDELSMFEIFDEDADSGSPDDVIKREGVNYEHFAADSNATLHALEVLASLDDTNANPVNEALDGRSNTNAQDLESPSDATSRLGTKTKMTAEEKKRRNRDCMRRLRNRRNDLIMTMRQEIQALEAQLNRQLDLAQSISPEPETGSRPENQERHHQVLQKLQVDHARIKTAMRRLREENYWLQKQVAQRQESLDTVRQLAQTHDESCPPVDVDALEEEDIGEWIRNTHHFMPPLEESRGFEIVMESYRIIQEMVRITQSMKSPPNAVLGWSDQRSVESHWANFMMQKTFPHENPRELALKTWRLMSNFEEINVLQPKAHEMKVLQRLNEYTIVVARHTYFENTKLSFCMIYLLFLLETDDGFVVGSRSLDPVEDRMQAFMAERMIVAKPFHCFHFRPDAGSNGCTLTFAGRVDSILARCAKSCAMDMLLAMMRWESHCISPLWRLAA